MGTENLKFVKKCLFTGKAPQKSPNKVQLNIFQSHFLSQRELNTDAFTKGGESYVTGGPVFG